MANRNNPFSRFRLVYKRSKPLTKIVVLCAIVLSMVALLAIRQQLLDAQTLKDSLNDKASQLEQENGQLEDKIGSLGSVDSVEQIAKDELGLVDPDTVIIQPES